MKFVDIINSIFMRLFLASHIRNPQTLKRLAEYIGGFADKSIAYIPTAANGEGWEHWQESETWALVQTLKAKVSLVILEQFRDQSVLTKLQGQDLIWFAGGYPGYLAYWARRCALDKHLKKILDQGSLYVGSSAGSMIAGQTLSVTEWYPGEPEAGAGIIPGLGLVDFDIYPHFKDEVLNLIKANYQGHKLYLLKDGEEIVVEDHKIILNGDQRIIGV